MLISNKEKVEQRNSYSGQSSLTGELVFQQEIANIKMMR